MTAVVQVEKLTKRYLIEERQGLFRATKKQITALDGISFQVRPGEIFGLLGPNGAGKTTLIKCLTTLLVPTSGTVRVNGFLLGREDQQIRATIGCMLMGERGLYWKLTGRENLIFFGALYRLPPAERARRADELIERLRLGAIAGRAVESYSSGQKMKFAFAKALLNDAPLLILDEPTNALDFPTARELQAVVRQLQQEGKTILYTTHIMSEAEMLCDRVAIIDRGQVLALGPVADLKASLRHEEIFSIEGLIPTEAVGALRGVPGVTRAATASVNGATQLTLVTQDARATLPGLMRALGRYDATVYQIQHRQTSLEDVFIAHTGRTLAEDTRETL